MRRTPAVLLILLLMVGSLQEATAHAADPPSEATVVTANGHVLPPMPSELRQPSVHADMLAEHAADTLDFDPGGPPTILLDRNGAPQAAGAAADLDGGLSAELSEAALPNGLRKEVFGFLPYWMLTDAALGSMNYTLVSTIAYFSVGANKDGY
ncbi:MAG TPA: hypothetical protein VES36_10760, partial [Candidatus Limnocylindrales bacterium]|nr:hypothetical protein [Candidatus Limnocylindrales bacterium]